MRLSDLRFLVAWLLPLLTINGIMNHPAYSALGTLVIWCGIALLDVLWPGGKSSPAALSPGADQFYFSWLLRLYVPLQMVLIVIGAYAVAQADWLVVFGVAFSVGFITGSQGITFAHEMGHSKSKFDRFCGSVLMTSVCYGHFMVEHYRGHHPRAATHDDPASSRRGESLYQFLPRTLWGSLQSGWNLEALRIAQMKSSWRRSPLVWCFLVSLMVFVLVTLYLPVQAAIKIIVYFAFQSVFAFVLLEIVNDTEHYGLQRKTAYGKREAST